jgi:hypothetical protein
VFSAMFSAMLSSVGNGCEYCLDLCDATKLATEVKVRKVSCFYIWLRLKKAVG